MLTVLLSSINVYTVSDGFFIEKLALPELVQLFLANASVSSSLPSTFPTEI
jgi:hypothetical protein